MSQTTPATSRLRSAAALAACLATLAAPAAAVAADGKTTNNGKRAGAAASFLDELGRKNG